MFLDSVSHPPDRIQPRAEWIFTGKIEDQGAFIHTCETCSRSGLRTVFVMRDATTGRVRRICKSCFGRKPVPVEVDGFILDSDQRQTVAKNLLARTQTQTCREAIRQVLQHTDDPALAEISAYFDRNLQLSPSRAAKLFPMLKQLRLGVDPSIFEIQIRSLGHKEEFGMLDETEKRSVWPTLSTGVRRRLTAMGLGLGAPRKLADALHLADRND